MKLPINCYICIIFICYGKLFFMYKFYNVINYSFRRKSVSFKGSANINSKLYDGNTISVFVTSN